MKITIIFPHRLRQGPFADLVAHYFKLASRAVTPALEVTTLRERNGEAPLKLVERLQQDDAICLSERGEEVDSRWFARLLDDTRTNARPLTFLVGDAEGLPPRLEQVCRRQIRLSGTTLPHELALVILAEQLWRAVSILSGHPYHK